MYRWICTPCIGMQDTGAPSQKLSGQTGSWTPGGSSSHVTTGSCPLATVAFAIIHNPFSIHVSHYILGKRKCLGENVALSTVFLFLANLLRKFSFTPASDQEHTDDPEGGLTIGPKPFAVKVICRHWKHQCLTRHETFKCICHEQLTKYRPLCK